MNRIYQLFIFVTALLINSSGFAEGYDYDAVYHKIVKEYTLNKDGSVEYHFYKKIELKTYYSFHRAYGETFIVYNPEFQSLKINKAFTTMADGKKVPVPENAFNEVLPAQAKNAPAYNHLREMVVTHTALEKGAVIELDYTITTKPGFFPVLLHREVLNKEIPVKEMELNISIPAEKTLYHQTSNIRTAPVTQKTASNKTYRWKFSNLEALPKDMHQADFHTFMPTVEFSTGNLMDAMASNFTENFNAESSDELNKEINVVFKNLGIKKKSKQEQVKAVYDYVLQKVNHYDVQDYYYGFNPRSAEEILSSNGATQFEASILLQAMFQLIDIKANVVFAYSGNPDKNLLFPEFSLVELQYEKKSFLLNPFNKSDFNPLYQYPDLLFYPISGKEAGNPIEIKDRKGENEFDIEMDLKLSKDGMISGEAEIELKGGMNPGFMFWMDQEEALRMVQKRLGIQLSDASIETSNNTTEIKAKVEMGSLQTMGDLKYISIGSISPVLKLFNASALPEKASGPISLNMLINEEVDISISIPKDIQIVSAERDTHIKSDFSSYELQIKHKKGKIEFEREITLDRAVFRPGEEYQQLKKLLLLFNDRESNQIFFR